jgi:fibronectin type 3 domain-containing protein
VTLNWNPSASIVDGYNVYRGTISGGPYTRINSALDTATSAMDNAVIAGQTYYYVVTAVAGSKESAYSNQATAVIPYP